jgi:capsular polysaccharide transport system permease protein
MMSGVVSLPGSLGRAALPSTGRPFPLFQAFIAQLRIIGLLIARQARTEFSQAPVKAGLGFLEPTIMIVIFYWIREFLQRDPRYGTSMLLFFATGFAPFYVFLNASSSARSAGRAMKSLRQFASITPLDVILANSIYRTIVVCPTYIGLFWLLWFYGISEAIPYTLDKVIGPIAAMFTLGLGVGMFNAGLTAVFPAWRVIYGFFGRAIMLTSGVQRVVEYTPEMYRQYMVWNPIMHAVEWFRSGFYHLYPTYSLDIHYLVSWSGTTLLLGLAFERVTRERLYGQKNQRV